MGGYFSGRINPENETLHTYYENILLPQISSTEILVNRNNHFKEVIRMAMVEYEGKQFDVDEDGFLLNFEQWAPEWVDFVKESEGISEMSDEHQKVIDFLQDYYKKNGIAPMVRILSKVTGFKLKHIYELFPSGPGKGACKMAGLPKPTGCV